MPFNINKVKLKLPMTGNCKNQAILPAYDTSTNF